MRRAIKIKDLHPAEIILATLLVFIPISIIFRFALSENRMLIFTVSCLGIIPLAGCMGKATESVAVRMGSGLGGLMNATFGNAAELIIAIIAIKEGHVEIVKASLTGSIIGNLLFVLGASMLLGGIKREKQTFNVTGASTGASMLLIAVISLLVPAIFHKVEPEASERALTEISIGIAVVLLAVYFLGLLFSLKTHRHLYAETEGDQNQVHWRLSTSVVILIISTALVALLSEFLVGSLEGAVKGFGFSHTFIGVIVIAVIGNAAEHSAAVMMAMKDKMNLSLNIAVESSKQIALFVAPILVFIGMLIGESISLEFTTFEVVAVSISVAIVITISHDGESNWLEGAMLLAVYLMLAVALYFVH